jgi:hypothetical protein
MAAFTIPFLFLALAPGISHTADGRPYGNARFGYWLDIPAGFSGIEESDNGDGGVSTSADGRAELRVWGGYMADDDFRAEMTERIGFDTGEGWKIVYEKRNSTRASWSGTKGARIFYERAIVACRSAAAYFRLEYDSSQKKVLDPVVAGLVKSLRKGSC